MNVVNCWQFFIFMSFFSQVQLLKCSCNSTCSRKQTSKEGRDGKIVNKGCPCKARGAKCTELCNCGTKKRGVITKPCKNGRPVIASAVMEVTENDVRAFIFLEKCRKILDS